jgi:hypothetical protein
MRDFSKICRFCILLVMLYLISACAGRGFTPDAPASEDDAQTRWAAFSAYCLNRAEQAKPFRINLSLNAVEKENVQTRRVTAILWSNGQNVTRLDVSAGVGVLLARIREGNAGLLIHAVEDNRVWFHNEPTRITLNFEIPIPFSLSEISAVLQGRFMDVLLQADMPDKFIQEPGGVICYATGSFPGQLCLGAQGLPRIWKLYPDSRNDAWTLRIEYDGSNPPLPERLRLAKPDGATAEILIKNRTVLDTPFTEAQLGLRLPPGVKPEPLREM